MARAGNRLIFTLECQSCKRRNYSSTKNKRSTPEKVLLKKYCSFCRKHTEHKETK
jgi:large subunit ribosomal protein L33